MKFLDNTGVSKLWSKTKTLLNGKVDKVDGKGLSTNDYTTAEKDKLAGIEAQANKYVLPTATKTTLGGIKLGERLDAEGTKVMATSLNSDFNPLTNVQSIYLGYSIDTESAYIILGEYKDPPEKMEEQYLFGSFYIHRGSIVSFVIKGQIDVTYGCSYTNRVINYNAWGSVTEHDDFGTRILGVYKVVVNNITYLALKTVPSSSMHVSFVGICKTIPFLKSSSQITSETPLDIPLEPSIRKRIENSILEKVAAGQTIENIMAYGVEWDTTVADPHLTRIGNMSLHKTLPIQSQLRGCIAQGDRIIYWLDEDNWKYKKGGNPNKGEPEQLARLDGYDGTVRVYCPSFYIKSKIIGNKRQVWLSTTRIDSTWTYQQALLIDAYRTTLLTTIPENMGYLSTLSYRSPISVVNTATYCRGGNDRTTYDKYLTGANNTPIDIFRTDLGKPRTDINRNDMRGCASNTVQSTILSYDQYKNIFYWLYVVEYANFNCQEAYNAELTDDGYHQGGMGPSITNVDLTKWNEYNEQYPITPCGYGNDLGNGTGLKTIVLPATTNRAESTHYMARWRGFDNPFGDTWTNLDGVIIDADADNHHNMDYIYTCQDPSYYNDSLNGEGYEKVGEEVHQDGYTKLFDLGDAAHIIPNVMGGNTTQYKCDSHWAGNKSTALRTLTVGGGSNNSASAGLGAFNSNRGVFGSWTNVGFRLVSPLPIMP